MAQYAGSDVFPVSFEEVNDGTARDAASVNVGLESLADRTIWLKNRTLDLTGPITFDGAVTFNQLVTANANIYLATGSDIYYSLNTGKLIVEQIGYPDYIESPANWGTDDPQKGSISTIVNTTQAIHWTPKLPVCTISSFAIKIDPSAHANLPASMPELRVNFWDAFNNGSPTQFTQTDTSGSGAAYSLIHSISCATTTLGVPFSFNPNLHKVTVSFYTESGANSANNLKVMALQVTYTKYKYD